MIARAITTRCFWPPERSRGYLSRNSSTGREPDPLERVDHPARAARRRWRPCGCAAGRATAVLDGHRRVERGVAGPGRPSAVPVRSAAQLAPRQHRDVRVVASSRSRIDAAGDAGTRPSSARPERGLAAARLSPTSAEHLALAAACRLTPSTALTVPVSRPSRRADGAAAQVEVDRRGRGRRRPCRRPRLRLRLRRQRPSSSCSSGAAAVGGIRSSGPCSQHSTRAPGRRRASPRGRVLARRPASRPGTAGGSGSPAAGRPGPAARRG